MINILQVSASYKPAYVYGGPTISVGNLCEQLAKKGFPVTVITTTANGKDDFQYSNNEVIERNGVQVRYFKRWTKDHSHFSPVLLKYIWQNGAKYDIIHIHAWWNLVSVGAAMICVLKNKKFILSPRGTLSSYSFNNRTTGLKKMFHSIIGKPLLKRAIFLVSSAKEQEDIMKLGVNRDDNMFIVPNIIELPADLPVRGLITSDTLRLIFFSRIEEKKGLEFIIDAFSYMDFPVQLDIYGTGDEVYINKLRQRALNSHKSSVINLKGPVYGDGKFKILSEYDILVLPSYDENFANVVIESLSVGTLVVVTKEVGLSDVVVEQDMGWLIERDARNIATVLSQAYIGVRHRKHRSRVTPALIKKMFDAGSIASQHLTLYTQIFK